VVILVHLFLVLRLLPVSDHLVYFRLTDGVEVSVGQAVHGRESFLRVEGKHAVEDGDAFFRHLTYIFAVQSFRLGDVREF